MSTPIWRGLAQQQRGVLARRQLNAMGVDSDRVAAQLRAERWQAITPTVVCTTTGALTREQRLWVGVLHCGGPSLIGGLTAAEEHGLRNWSRDDVSVLVDDERILDPVPGFLFTRTRRPLALFRDPRTDLPLCRLEPAVLLWAAYQRSHRTGVGVLAACIQQGLTTPDELRRWILAMRPLRWSKRFQLALTEFEGGVRSVAELDVSRMCRRFGLPRPDRQVRRKDAAGRVRYTDAEWRLSEARVVVLEIDGAFHLDVDHWEEDIARQRALTDPNRFIIRATAREVRDEPESVVRDLVRLGVRGRVRLDVL